MVVDRARSVSGEIICASRWRCWGSLRVPCCCHIRRSVQQNLGLRVDTASGGHYSVAPSSLSTVDLSSVSSQMDTLQVWRALDCGDGFSRATYSNMESRCT